MKKTVTAMIVATPKTIEHRKNIGDSGIMTTYSVEYKGTIVAVDWQGRTVTNLDLDVEVRGYTHLYKVVRQQLEDIFEGYILDIHDHIKTNIEWNSYPITVTK